MCRGDDQKNTEVIHDERNIFKTVEGRSVHSNTVGRALQNLQG